MNQKNFFDPGKLEDGDLYLVLLRFEERGTIPGFAPAYHFAMHLKNTANAVGLIQLRVDKTRFLTHYAGQVGFTVHPEFRGKHLSARSCRLLFPLAKLHGINPLWITCNPDNLASRRTCEIAGGKLVEIVEVPHDCQIYTRGDRLKCRYRVDL